MASVKSPAELLGRELKEIHSAERQLSRALPRLRKRVSSPSLAKMLEARRGQGEALIEEIDEILDEMEVAKARPKNIAAEGLLDDVNQHLDELENGKLIDPVLLASMQKIEHYCIAAWGTAASMGRLLETPSVVRTMERVLTEGKRFDDQMTKLAETEINPAMLADEHDAEEEPNQPRRRGGRRARKR